MLRSDLDAAAASDPAAAAPGLWPLVTARAAVLLLLGLVLTFAQDRSATLGLLTFGVAVLVLGALLLLGAGRGARAARGLSRLQAAALLAGGLASLAFAWAGPLVLVIVVAATALLSGGFELAAGLRARGVFSRDQLLSGGLTVLLGVVVALVPPGYAAAFHGREPVSGVLTASVVVLGVVGAWAIIEGVFLGIAAVSLRDAAKREGAG